MPVIQVKDKQHTLQPGQTRIGAGPGVEVNVSSDDALGVQAVLDLDANNQVVIRRAREGAVVKVNGVALGVEPTPLMHGDKVDVGGTEILFSEDKKVGATQFVSASEVASIAAKRSGPVRATASTGGRLVSLVDGKEYQIPAAGVVFGREAGSDVVVAQPEVSRRHASIAPSEAGYVLQDLSTNGVWVNGNRVQGSQVLARSDVVRVGSEEFRFYADVAPASKGAGTPASVPASSHSQPTPVVATPVQPVAPTPPRADPTTPPPMAAAKPTPVAAPPGRIEPPTVPAAVGVGQASRPEPPTGPVGGAAKAAAVVAPAAPPQAPAGSAAPAAPRPQPMKPKREAATAPKAEKGGGVPAWVWLLIIVIVAVAAYFLGQGTLLKGTG